MSLFGRDANGGDAYIRASGTPSATDGLVTFHDAFTNDLKYKALDLTAVLTLLRSSLILSFESCL